jgi:hypothetical protein
MVKIATHAWCAEDFGPGHQPRTIEKAGVGTTP